MTSATIGRFSVEVRNVDPSPCQAMRNVHVVSARGAQSKFPQNLSDRIAAIDRSAQHLVRIFQVLYHDVVSAGTRDQSTGACVYYLTREDISLCRGDQRSGPQGGTRTRMPLGLRTSIVGVYQIPPPREGLVDPGRIELPLPRCERGALPLSQRPTSDGRIGGGTGI